MVFSSFSLGWELKTDIFLGLKHPHPHFRSTFQCQIPHLQWWEVPEQLLLSEGIAEIYTELLEAEQRARQMGNGGWF